MSDKKDDDYVGYGHPPKKHRFKPGQSGNPRGASKKEQQHIGDIYTKLFMTYVTIRMNNKSMRVSILEAIALGQMHKAIGGDFKTSKYFLDRAKELLPHSEAIRTHEEWLRILSEEEEADKKDGEEGDKEIKN